jgi:16S rRNA (cytosine1402-N4)-methyltransferase
MDQRQERTAKDIVNTESEGRLKEILSLYGEIPNAGRMARAIVAARSQKAIETTFGLSKAVEKLIPRNQENKYLAMLFQALRIEVNGEMEALEMMLKQAVEILKPGGRLVVISYHSLEDRMVKNLVKSGNIEGNIEKDFYGNVITNLTAITRKPITPSEQELQENNRSRSAKLRIAEKREESV